VTLNIHLEGMDQEEEQKLVDAAHIVSQYPNANRNNIDVNLNDSTQTFLMNSYPEKIASRELILHYIFQNLPAPSFLKSYFSFPHLKTAAKLKDLYIMILIYNNLIYIDVKTCSSEFSPAYHCYSLFCRSLSLRKNSPTGKISG